MSLLSDCQVADVLEQMVNEHYVNYTFMCNLLEARGSKMGLDDQQVIQIHRIISARMGGRFTLDAYLLDISDEYADLKIQKIYATRAGQTEVRDELSERQFQLRAAWFKDWIVELRHGSNQIKGEQ